MMNVPVISPDAALDVLKIFAEMEAPPSVMLLGAPGIGKSRIVHDLARYIAKRENKTVTLLPPRHEDELFLSDIRLTTVEPQDLRGLPYFLDSPEGEKMTYYSRPSFLPPPKGRHIIFLDEITNADYRLQSSAYQLLLDRRVGDHVISPETMIIAAGNPEEFGGNSTMSPAIIDRLVVLSVAASPEAWLSWAKDNDIVPEVISFIAARPDFLDASQKRASTNKVAASPRGWERVSTVLKAASKNGLNYSAVRNAIAGIVGQDAMVEFYLSLEEMSSLVNVKDLMEMDYEELLNKLPELANSVIKLYNIVYSVLPLIDGPKTIDKTFEIFLAIKEGDFKSNSLPNHEVATLGFELAIERGEKLGLMKAMLLSKAYKKYVEIRKAQGLL